VPQSTQRDIPVAAVAAVGVHSQQTVELNSSHMVTRLGVGSACTGVHWSLNTAPETSDRRMVLNPR